MRPLVILNFKTYKEAVGDQGVRLAKKLAGAKKNKYRVVLAPTLLTTKEIVKVGMPVFAQHADGYPLGAHTGRALVEELKMIGVKGMLLNHSERKIPFNYLKDIVLACKKHKLTTVVCASSMSEVKKVAQLKPEYLAYEPPELIGGDISVTKAKPDVLVKAVDAVKKISSKTKVLCGAGIHSREDVGQALLLGTSGVLIGHAVPKAKDPKKFLEALLI